MATSNISFTFTIRCAPAKESAIKNAVKAFLKNESVDSWFHKAGRYTFKGKKGSGQLLLASLFPVIFRMSYYDSFQSKFEAALVAIDPTATLGIEWEDADD